MEYQIYVMKAKENLAAAETCLNSGYRNASVSRAYYAMFQAAIALLIHKGIKPPSGSFGHQWVQSMVSEKFTKRQKIMSREYASYLLEAQEIRNRADYSLIDTSKTVCQKQLSKARDFSERLLEELPHVSQS